MKPFSAFRPLIRIIIFPILFLLMLYWSIVFYYSIDREPLLDSKSAQSYLQALRRSLNDKNATYQGKDYVLEHPLFLSLFHRGEVVFRRVFTRGKLQASFRYFAKELRVFSREKPKLCELGQFKLDIALDRGPVITTIPLFFAKGIVPGEDGLGLTIDEKRHSYLLPDDLYKQEILANFQPFYFMLEFKTGLDIKTAINLFAADLSLTLDDWKKARKEFFRFSLQSFVEDPQKAIKSVQRLRIKVDQINQNVLRQAAERGADYVLRQLRDDGKFYYIYYPLQDRHYAGGAYNLPRHAGTTWFLSLSYAHLKHKRYKNAAERAIQYLSAHAVPPACQKGSFACVGSNAYADLGSAGLTLVAIIEYMEATGDRQFERLARRLGEFILFMQKDDGNFCHQYYPHRKKKNCDSVLLYYSGEATLGLARLAKFTKDDARYKEPLKRALDFLVDKKYQFFLGKFFISEDHWTCIAAEAAYPMVQDLSYLDFCIEFAKLNRRAQIRKEDELGDLWGAFNITPFFMPHNTPVGSRSEANVGTYLLSKHMKRPNELTLITIKSAMRYLVDQQIDPRRTYLLPNPNAASGGITQTPMRASIRIDYVQHSAAAMVRALTLFSQEDWPAVE